MPSPRSKLSEKQECKFAIIVARNAVLYYDVHVDAGELVHRSCFALLLSWELWGISANTLQSWPNLSPHQYAAIPVWFVHVLSGQPLLPCEPVLDLKPEASIPYWLRGQWRCKWFHYYLKGKTVDLEQVDQHRFISIPLATVGGVAPFQQGEVLLIMHQ